MATWMNKKNKTSIDIDQLTKHIFKCYHIKCKLIYIKNNEIWNYRIIVDDKSRLLHNFDDVNSVTIMMAVFI